LAREVKDDDDLGVEMGGDGGDVDKSGVGTTVCDAADAGSGSSEFSDGGSDAVGADDFLEESKLGAEGEGEA